MGARFRACGWDQPGGCRCSERCTFQRGELHQDHSAYTTARGQRVLVAVAGGCVCVCWQHVGGGAVPELPVHEHAGARWPRQQTLCRQAWLLSGNSLCGRTHISQLGTVAMRVYTGASAM
jgi:hypothetical protein